MKKLSADRFQQNTAPSLSFLPLFLYLFLSLFNSLFQSLIFCIYFYSTSRFVSFLLSLSCTLILYQDDRDSPFWEDIPYTFVFYPNDRCPRLFQFITWTEGKHKFYLLLNSNENTSHWRLINYRVLLLPILFTEFERCELRRLLFMMKSIIMSSVC